MNNRKLDIFIFSYSDIDEYPKNEAYKIVSCGSRMNGTYDIPLYNDNTGDNISCWNKSFCEWTGIYWVWKNLELKDYVGINQERRFFEFYNNIPDIENILSSADIITGNMIQLGMNCATHYFICHFIEDYSLLAEILYEKDRLLFNDFDLFSKSKSFFPCNISIMKREKFVEMCEFVFPIMFEFMKRRGFHSMDDIMSYVNSKEQVILSKKFSPNNTVEYQCRILAYIAERLVNLFIMAKCNGIYAMNVIETHQKYGCNIFQPKTEHPSTE